MLENSLFERLGSENLRSLVNTFYSNVEQDKRISHLFKNDFEEIKRKQFAFLTQFLGGPPLYHEEFGHPRMRMRHMPHAITPDAAVAWLENMKKAIDSLPISDDLKLELFNAFPRLASHMINSPNP